MIHTVAAALGLAWQALSPQAIDHAQAGIAAQKAGHLPEAIVEFRKVTELAPQLAAAFVNLGAAYMENRQYEEALAPLKKSLDLNPNLVGAQQMLGYALLKQGYAAEAIPYLEKVHDEAALGIAQLNTGKFQDAITNLSAALQKRPNDPELLYYLGRASGLLSKEVFDTLESGFPTAARTHQAMGENLAVLKRIPEAEKEYLAAIQLAPAAPGIHLALGLLYTSDSEWPKAEEQFRAEAKLQPGDAETAYHSGNALLQEGKIQGARSELERANQLRPSMPETLYALGKANSLGGNVAMAEKSWLQVINLEKTGSLAAQAHFGLAALYRKQGKAADAEREMQAYKQLQAPK